MKRVAILGSTGSIGESALEVLSGLNGFKPLALSANKNLGLLKKQILKYRPDFASVSNKLDAQELARQVKGRTKILYGREGLEELAMSRQIDIVLIALSGFAAIYPLLSAIRADKHIGLANKEALVAAGSLIRRALNKSKARIVPIDSEQSAIFQCLKGETKGLKKIYLTASGGPFYFKKSIKLDKVSKHEVLKHPRWKMGEKITVDSANLMNKGLEVIETKWLFDVAAKDIKVLIHPEAVVHSLVEFVDSSVLAQLSVPDMRLPIQYALTFPERKSFAFERLNLAERGGLSFFEPDLKRFPALSLAFNVADMKESAQAVLNAANEEAVAAFLAEGISFCDIIKVVERVIKRHIPFSPKNIQQVISIDNWARRCAQEQISRIK